MSVYPVKLLNVPFTSKDSEVYNFIKSAGIVDMEVFISLHKLGEHKGHTDGNAFVLLFNIDDVDKCLSLNGKNMRDRRIKIFETTLLHMKESFLTPTPTQDLFKNITNCKQKLLNRNNCKEVYNLHNDFNSDKRKNYIRDDYNQEFCKKNLYNRRNTYDHYFNERESINNDRRFYTHNNETIISNNFNLPEKIPNSQNNGYNNHCTLSSTLNVKPNIISNNYSDKFVYNNLQNNHVNKYKIPEKSLINSYDHLNNNTRNFSNNNYPNNLFSSNLNIHQNYKNDINYNSKINNPPYYLKLFNFSSNVSENDIYKFLNNTVNFNKIYYVKFLAGPYINKLNGEVIIEVVNEQDIINGLKLNGLLYNNFIIYVVFPTHEEIETIIWQYQHNDFILNNSNISKFSAISNINTLDNDNSYQNSYQNNFVSNEKNEIPQVPFSALTKSHEIPIIDQTKNLYFKEMYKNNDKIEINNLKFDCNLKNNNFNNFNCNQQNNNNNNNNNDGRKEIKREWHANNYKQNKNIFRDTGCFLEFSKVSSNIKISEILEFVKGYDIVERSLIAHQSKFKGPYNDWTLRFTSNKEAFRALNTLKNKCIRNYPIQLSLF